MGNLKENITKATQTADLLIQDLQAALSFADQATELLVDPQLKLAETLKSHLQGLLSGISDQSTDGHACRSLSSEELETILDARTERVISEVDRKREATNAVVIDGITAHPVFGGFMRDVVKLWIKNGRDLKSIVEQLAKPRAYIVTDPVIIEESTPEAAIKKAQEAAMRLDTL